MHGSGRTFGGGPDEVDTESVYLDYHDFLQTKTEGTPTLTPQVTKITRREVIFANDYSFPAWLQGFLDYGLGKGWKEHFIDDNGRPPVGWKIIGNDHAGFGETPRDPTPGLR